jgi:hypothetical protein
MASKAGRVISARPPREGLDGETADPGSGSQGVGVATMEVAVVVVVVEEEARAEAGGADDDDDDEVVHCPSPADPRKVFCHDNGGRETASSGMEPV